MGLSARTSPSVSESRDVHEMNDKSGTMVIDVVKAKELVQQGFTIIPLLSHIDIEKLKRLFRATEPFSGVDKGFYTSIWSMNKEYRTQVDAGIKEILIPRMEGILADYKPVFANFMVKHAGDDTKLDAHQDWSFTTEPEFESLTIWIPLVSVTMENGALSIVPGSQKLTNYIRPRFANSPFQNHHDYIEHNMLQSIAVSAGDAILMNSRCIHASPLNSSSYTRIAASVVLIPKDAPMTHYVQDPQDLKVVRELRVDSDFFVNASCFEIPSGYQNGTLSSFNYREMTKEELVDSCRFVSISA